MREDEERKIYLFTRLVVRQNILTKIKEKKEVASFEPFRSIREVGQAKKKTSKKEKEERYRQRGEEILFITPFVSIRNRPRPRFSKTKRREGGFSGSACPSERERERMSDNKRGLTLLSRRGDTRLLGEYLR